MSVSIPKQETSTAAPTRSRSIYARMVPIVVNSLFAAVLITLTDILSPIYPRVLETWYSDQYIFELTGKMWAEGGIPYVNFWDQKGPLIFLFNMLGWKLTESSLGIFLLTIVWAAVTVNMLYLLAREFTPQRHGTAMVVTIAWISAVWIGILCAPSWNLIEPLCLPFLAVSLLIAVRWFKQCDSDHGSVVPWWHPFVYGLSFSVCLLSRLTNALSVCVGVLVIAIMLLRWKQWMALLKCALSFIVGIALPLIPFCVYFAAHHAFYDFVYGTVLFNISYAGNSESLLSSQINTIVLILCLPCAMVLVSLAHMLLERRCNPLDWTIAISGILFIVLFFNISPYQHYAAVAAIFLPILLGGVCRYADQHIHMHWQTLVALGLVMALLCGYQAKVDNKLIWSEPTYDEPELEQVIQEAHGDIVLYNVLVGAYLQYDLKPMYRFAWLQDWEASFSDSYAKLLREEFATARAKYIVVQPYYTMPKPAIDRILHDRYKPVRTITVEGMDTVVYERR
ncbi:hypothetical protein [Bifidobacterium dentium]|uniref:Glycosyltransferase RgtA/B/C/D-like domain-containing protein n=2 Tax=Bifidobacterium dentium TaxID=1689 RepID=D2Q647_BIFDB|nr:hypothetical protein [Bifidobacterium dentium]ADB10412.1 Conserved hypothetical protein [Bifidobacterium dentium Bd1]SEC38455.1 hypothetical protein SAMN05192536_1726 [Bifidobacterium dentium JCM 1195 = DSM 20436]VEG24394.1 Phosphoglycerol transferase and related proteins, alkaline phosphatase superfamily [Bifidobacterium dentium]